MKPVAYGPNPSSDFSDRIKQIRVRFGLTQARLAQLIGVSFASVNRWENGLSKPSRLAWQKLLHVDSRGIGSFDAPREGHALPMKPEPRSAIGTSGPPIIDFTADPELVRAVAEGERLAHGHLVNPAFAAEVSLIDPLPHQRIAVYEQMLVQPRLRYLLADDAGAGKTIMSGLYIREMFSRGLIRRVLIIPPAGLVGNWEREMRTLFGLSFRIAEGSDFRTGNPFSDPDGDRLVVSMDTLASVRAFSRLQERTVERYDLVIFDEAHKLSADREPDYGIRKTDRYRLAEVLAGIPSEDERWSLSWSAHHLLLLTATPHMGKDYPYYALWKLLEPQILPTFDAFQSFPPEARRRHFIRRTKEEMVRFDGTPIYPTRTSDTLGYELTRGEGSEQELYDKTSAYIRTYYNRARILNRSAARLAMSVFQRRLASSTYALIRSFERRMEKLDGFIEDLQSGKIDLEQIAAAQATKRIPDPYEEMTAEEEGTVDGREEGEAEEEKALGSVVATTLAELINERMQVQALLDLGRKVSESGRGSKFEKLLEILRDPRFKDEKWIVFTEHRDTLRFLMSGLEGVGLTGRVAQIHGGMDFREREEQVEFFRKPASEGGAGYLIATDAAGEGINLQFCWLMVNFDIPWNPARLEQRMGRIHRYNQKHDPVVIVNLVADKTREGRVLKTLLDKLERIRKELRSDKVFDVVGRLFRGVSIKDYMEKVVLEPGSDVEGKIEGSLTREQVLAIEEKDRALYGDGGDVVRELGRLKRDVDQETYRRLIPGYVRRFVEKAAPLVGIGIDGSLDGFFSFKAIRPGALDPLLPALESYLPAQRSRITVNRPEDASTGIFFHPGDHLFDRFLELVRSLLGSDAVKGAVFVDPGAEKPYLLHLAQITVKRRADPTIRAFANKEILECRLAGFKEDGDGAITECPVEHLLLLKGGSSDPASARRFAAIAPESRESVRSYCLERVAHPLAEVRRRPLMQSLPERADFLRRGFDYQDGELAAARAGIAGKARRGDPRARAELERIKDRQRKIADQREDALIRLRREPDLIVPGDVTFFAHALVIPSGDAMDRKRRDDEIEAIAVRVSTVYEETDGAVVRNVSTPPEARAAGLTDHPGFDLLSVRPGGEERAIEVKGRAGTGDLELTENEWAKACNLRGRYWLYVVYDCAGPQPRLLRVRDPFGTLLRRERGGVIIDEKSVLASAEAL